MCVCVCMCVCVYVYVCVCVCVFVYLNTPCLDAVGVYANEVPFPLRWRRGKGGVRGETNAGTGKEGKRWR